VVVDVVVVVVVGTVTVVVVVVGAVVVVVVVGPALGQRPSLSGFDTMKSFDPTFLIFASGPNFTW
jgi:hypothetical protein